jgi:hypothetical protein
VGPYSGSPGLSLSNRFETKRNKFSALEYPDYCTENFMNNIKHLMTDRSATESKVNEIMSADNYIPNVNVLSDVFVCVM